jgi:hypothetical protein
MDHLNKSSNSKQMFYCSKNCHKNDYICGHKFESHLYQNFVQQINKTQDMSQTIETL